MYRTCNSGVEQVVFRRFGRKGWCIFRSLSLNIRIGVLSVATLATAISYKAHAEAISNETYAAVDDDETDLDEVTVQTAIAPLTMLQSARIVTVITRKEIEQAGATTVNDLLKLASGVDVRQRGGWGAQTDISVDGASYEQVTVLLNGMNISNPHTGHLSADFPVTVCDIERIEVLEGAAGRAYGTHAFGGAVNIVTKTHSHQISVDSVSRKSCWELELGAQGGMHGTILGDGRAGWQKGKLYSSMSFAGGRSAGGVPNSDWKKGNVYVQGSYSLSRSVPADNSRLFWQLGYSGKSYGANTFYSGSSNDQFESNDRILLNVQMDAGKKVHLSPSIYWRKRCICLHQSIGFAHTMITSGTEVLRPIRITAMYMACVLIPGSGGQYVVLPWEQRCAGRALCLHRWVITVVPTCRSILNIMSCSGNGHSVWDFLP